MATKVKRRSHHILVEVRASFMTEEHLPVEADQGACAFVLLYSVKKVQNFIGE
ncbi:hypothetical protein ACE1TI_03960 [Alteribacillus sp. JSM 102045]|uniref:hypothetical protein n=1 Tax=Alteribacillus sp. JSM 102045 TaxID=1562101 RepID=UPI0035BF7EBC